MSEKLKLEEIEEVIMDYVGDFITIEQDENYMIAVGDTRVVIPELGISVREGTYFNYDEEEDDYVADFSITLVYGENESEPTKYDMWEQDSILVTIYNYVSGEYKDMEKLVNLECHIVND